jgi:hypothetical protein
MTTVPVRVVPRGFGQTTRRDTWWTVPAIVFTVFSAFIIYATWAAFEGRDYTFGPYLSPFYSPEIFGESPHAWFGPKPAIWPAWLPFSPALLILPFPGLFRFTCYYYRGAYYKAFWADPPSCAVGEPRSGYRGENSFPLILQNVHRYFMFIAMGFLVVLAWDAWKGFWFADPATGTTHFGIGIGSLVLVANVVLLSLYALGCHSFRHLIGGRKDSLSSDTLASAYRCVTCLNDRHMLWAWCSLFSVALTDLYVRLCARGVITDVRLF